MAVETVVYGTILYEWASLDVSAFHACERS